MSTARQISLVGGKIPTWALEVPLADHCNLRCAHCCPASPSRAPYFIAPSEIERDLSRCLLWLRPSIVKLTGGEPTLHPQLVDCIRAARRAHAGRLSMTTNGFLLDRVPDEALADLDGLTLSWYASRPLPKASMERIASRCAAAGVVLTVKHVERFQVLDAPEPHDRDVFGTCWMRVRCHQVHRGVFTLCTRPAAFADKGVDPRRDGLPLDPLPSFPEVYDYVTRTEPLESCRHCLGASGPWEPHRQLPPRGTAPAGTAPASP